MDLEVRNCPEISSKFVHGSECGFVSGKSVIFTKRCVGASLPCHFNVEN